jgi:multiple sugar transport system permease protein
VSTRTAGEGLTRARQGVGVGGSGSSRGPRTKGRPGASPWTLFAFAVPALVLLLLLNLYPVIYAAYQSLRDGSLISAGDFVAFKNYVDVLSDAEFWAAARFTVIFTLVGVFGSWVVGLALAILLKTRIPGKTLFRVLLLLPWVVPVVVSATAWNWLVATPQSPFPVLAQWLGLGNVLFLANPLLAQITVCVFKVWISFPFMMMMMAAALESVDNNVYEASRVDGASKWKTLTNITLPMISRSTYISWILMTIFCVNDFTTIFLLTGGGPVNATQSLVVLAYNTVFLNFDTGPGVAVAFLMTLVLIIISVVLFRQIRKVQIL